MTPAVLPRAPRWRPPAGACDAHTHVIGPEDRFPLVHKPADFSAPLAAADLHRRMLDIVGIDRAIIVQAASLQGLDMRGLLDALSRSGGNMRGVGVANAEIADAELAALDHGGVRALRFVEASSPGGGKRAGAVGFDEARKLATRIAALGWHIQLWAPLSIILAEIDDLLGFGMPVVLDHMGMPDIAHGTNAPGFQRLLALVRERRVWVKLSLCRCSQQAPGYDDLKPFHDALVSAGPNCLLWGSDWPHIRMQSREPDVGALLDRFRLWVGDESAARKILVDNPARLFGFPPSPTQARPA